MSADVIRTEGVVLDGGIRISDISATAGDVLWAEVASSLYTDVFISLCLGLLKPIKGKYRLAGGRVTNSKQKNIISFFDASWNAGVKDADTFVKMIALSYGEQISTVSSEFKRILIGLGAEYALKLDFNELKPATRSIVSTAATLSMPLLVVMLKEPYYGLEKQGSDFLNNEIARISKDGSLVMVFAGSTPAFYTKRTHIIEEY